jgi:FkbM family methyltransferase
MMGLSKLLKRNNSIVDYLRKEPNLQSPKQIADQINSKEPVISFRYKDDQLYIINEEVALYHIVHTTAKMEKLADAVPKNSTGVMLDIGANVGLYSYFYKKRCPDAKAFLFEPDKRLVPVIEKNLQHFSNWEVLNSAVGETSGQIDFFFNPKSSQTNSTEREALLPFMKNEEIVGEKVQSLRLSDFCSQRNIQSIETLKIDIQGGEFKVLKASEDILTITKTAFVEICFLMPDTIPLVKLMDQYFKKYEPVTEIIMGADLKFYN